MFFWTLLQGADITVHKPHPLIGCACTQQGVLLRSALLLILYAIILCHWFVTAREGNVFTGVCLSTGGRRFGFLACITGHMTGGSAQPPLDANLPPMQTAPGYRPSLEADPPWDTTGYGKQAAGTHPTRMHSCWFGIAYELSMKFKDYTQGCMRYKITEIFSYWLKNREVSKR